ncbi:MAG: hypothetical protein ABW352_10230 [Polyangiales bacterium]
MDLLKSALAAVLLVGCVPDLDSDESTVVQARVLAIQAEPAEVTPNGINRTTYRALIADGNGVRADVPLSWFQCIAQKPLAELGPVSRDCFSTESGKLVEFGSGPEASGALPSSACSLFGPNPPLAVGGEAPGRPVDADQTGGYKMPIVTALQGEAGQNIELYEQRIICGLVGVSREVSVAFATRYHANANPFIAELRAVRAGGSLLLAPDQPLELAANEEVQLEVLWPTCPESDVCGDGLCGPDETAQACAADCQPLRGCGGQERYLRYDRQESELVTERESMRAAWYATHGSYDFERTGAEPDPTIGGTGNTFRAPSSPVSGTLWVVLRDSRGGVTFRSQPFVVR